MERGGREGPMKVDHEGGGGDQEKIPRNSDSIYIPETILLQWREASLAWLSPRLHLRTSSRKFPQISSVALPMVTTRKSNN